MPLSVQPQITQTEFARIVQALEESVHRNLSEGILLSGGLDTSILAGVAARWQKLDCVTVAFANTPGPDIPYARQVAQLFNLKYTIHYFGEEELEEGLAQAVRVLKTFDPMEIRNSAAAWVALRIARDLGLKTVMTGDGGDELWAGYSFFFDMTKEQLDKALASMWTNMSFSSIDLAKSLGIEVKLPFLDPEFKDFAMKTDSGLKVRQEKGQMFGKWVLRKAFESLLTPELVWRVKAPLEVGTGTTTLPAFFDARIADAEFTRKQRQYLNEDKIKIRNKEHLHYYEIYRREVGINGLSIGAGRRCPDCGAGVKETTNYCRTCGAYPI
jgi:asparagine synthase (glutamine-hydrolysing)